MRRSERSEARMRNLLALAACLEVGLIAIAGVHAQAIGPVWDVPALIPATDREDILALARDMGIPQPQRVTLDGYSSSSNICTVVDVEAPDIMNGNEVRTTILKIIRPGNDPVRCQPVALHRRGRWLVTPTGATTERRRWRIHDPAGAVDLALLDVPYDDAVAIVRAVRRRSMAERCPAWKNVMPQMVTSIRKTSFDVAPDDKVPALVPGAMASRRLPPGTYHVLFESTGGLASTTATVGDSDVSFDCQGFLFQR